MAARFWVGGTGTWDAVTTTNWAASSGGAGGQSVPVSADTVTFDGSSGGGTVTVNTDFTITSLTFGAFTGTLDFATNDNSPTIGTVSGTGSGTRTLNMGDGVWTLTGVGSIWDYSTKTGLTHNRNGSSIISTGTSNQRTFIANGESFGALTINRNTGGFAFSLGAGGGTYASLSVNGPQNIVLNQGTTTTIETAFSWGASGSAPLQIESASTGSAATISVASGNCRIASSSLRLLTFSGGATFTAVNSFNLGGNTGITITPPSVGIVGG